MPRPDLDETPRQYLPVAELLRREGIEFEGDDSPTETFAAVPAGPPAPRSRAEAPVRAEPPEPADRGRTSAKAATWGRVVLFGLTVAGLVAFKPGVASTPVEEGPREADQALSAPQGAQPGLSAQRDRSGGGSAPTTAAGSVLLSETTDLQAPPADSRGGTGGDSGDSGGTGGTGTSTGSTGRAGGTGGGDGADSGAPAPTTAPQPTTTRSQEPAPTTPPATSQPSPTTTSEPRNGGVLDPVLDPVNGVVSGVLDLGGGLLGG
ncbi:hypothetical protein [Prauserella shujinwangii]|nr:hypothetical protein [Prauserella shujinwangii]